MNDQIIAILKANDAETRDLFKVHCEKLESEGLEDIKFCLKGYDSVESIQRQLLAVEKMDELGLTVALDDFVIFNENYSI